MIYVDTSVVPAQLLSEDRKPPAGLWSEPLVSSRLLEYESWTLVNNRRLAASHGEALRSLLAKIALLELLPVVLGRAVEPFPGPVRTLAALHLASMDFLRSQRVEVTLATYDARDAARRLDIPIQIQGG